MSAIRNILAAVLASAAAAAAVPSLAGCGGHPSDSDAPLVRPLSTTTSDEGPFAQLTGRQVMSRAEAAMKGAPSLTVRMDGSEKGTPMHVQVVVTRSGRCAAAIRADEDDVQLIGTGKAFYMKADAAFWRANGGADGAKMAEVLAGKWLKLPPSSLRGGGMMDEMCDLRTMIDSFAGDDDTGTMTKGHPTTLDGRRVLPIIHRKPGGTTTIYVAATGKPYVLESTTPGGDSPLTAVFTDYGRVPRISAPPADQTVDVSSFGNPDGFSI